MNNLLSIIISIFKAGLISLFIVIGLYLIEKNSELIFFVKEFKSKKSIRHAEINHDRDQGYYFIITSIVYIYDFVIIVTLIKIRKIIIVQVLL